MKVMLHNPNSGELKAVKVGWSWTLFFFSGFFGLPLFLRKLHYWGMFFLIQPVLFDFIPDPPEDKEDAVILGMAYLIMVLIQLGLYVFMAIKGNEMTAKNLLEKGWKFAHPDAIETQVAKRGAPVPRCIDYEASAMRQKRKFAAVTANDRHRADSGLSAFSRRRVCSCHYAADLKVECPFSPQTPERRTVPRGEAAIRDVCVDRLRLMSGRCVYPFRWG